MIYSIKKYYKILLVIGICLLPCNAFSSFALQTKVTVNEISSQLESLKKQKMIHDALSKYCVLKDKNLCKTKAEGWYDPNTPFCLCKDGMTYNKKERKCEDCKSGTYYKKLMKTNICKGCSAGKYQPKSGQSECLNCDAGACFEVRDNMTKCEYKCNNFEACRSGSCMKCELNSDSNWQELNLDSLNGKLDKGIYKVELAGGKGGTGGYSYISNGGGCGSNTLYGEKGKQGNVVKERFILKTKMSYTVNIGNRGSNGSHHSSNDDEGGGGQGKKGGSSSFQIKNIISLSAQGGDGGRGAYNDDSYCGTTGNSACSCYQYGQESDLIAHEGDNGYIKIYKCY